MFDLKTICREYIIMDEWFGTGYTKLLKGPEDFFVEEVIEPKFLRRFLVRGGKVERMGGKHALCRLKKRGRNTEDVIGEISRKLGIPERDVGYAGLKDRNAVTVQYVTIKNVKKSCLEKIRLKDAELSFLKKTDKQICVGDLVGNKFRIKLHGVKDGKGLEKGLRSVRRTGFPNFYGPQRFGRDFKNQETGKLVLKGKTKVEKKKAKFFIHAYQGFLFNRALERFLEKGGKPFYREVDVLGFGSGKPKNEIEREIWRLAKRDGITRESFRITESRLLCRGTRRAGFVKPAGLKWKRGRVWVLEFFLPKGSYGSVLLNRVLGKQK